MNDLQKNLVSGGVAFGVMVVTATLAYAIPIPPVREVLTDHLLGVIVWTVATSVGWLAARFVYGRLP